jgi:hypothetical protein
VTPAIAPTRSQRIQGRLRRLRTAWTLLALLIGLNEAPTSGQSAVGPELRLKAAFVYNFTMFAQWPADAFVGGGDPLIIGVVGRDPFEGNLELLLEGKHVGGRSFKVIAIGAADAVHLAGVRAHLLFISRSEGSRASELLHQVRTLPILTVSEIPEFADRGGMIEMYEDTGTLRFAINPTAAKGAGLKISSKLLALARISVGSKTVAFLTP